MTRSLSIENQDANTSLQFIALVVALFVLLVGNSGCKYTGGFREYVHKGFKVGPNFVTPTAEVEPHWIDADNPRLLNEPVRYDHWWTVFDDPVMDNLIQQMRCQNLTLQEAGLRVIEARRELGIAVGSLFPQDQKLTGAYRRTQISKTTIENAPLVAEDVPRAFDRWSTGFDAAWELDFWGKFRRSVEVADARLNATVEEYDDLLVTLIAETASAYVELRTFEERIRLANLNIKAQQGLLDIARSRYESGTTDEMDVFQAETNVANTKAILPQLEVRRREAEIRLCILLGLPPRDLEKELGPAPIPVAPEFAVVGIPCDLLRRRPDIRRAEWAVAEQSARVGIAVADLLPQFALRGTLRYESNQFDDLFRASSLAGIVSPGFKWDVLNYGRIENNILMQDARFQRVLTGYEQTVLEANADVERALISFIEGHKAVQYLSEAVAANESALNIATDQFRLGDTNYNQIFTLQAFLVEEQDALAEAQGAVCRSLIRIYKALGGGWEIRCGEGGVPVLFEGGLDDLDKLAPAREPQPDPTDSELPISELPISESPMDESGYFGE